MSVLDSEIREFIKKITTAATVRNEISGDSSHIYKLSFAGLANSGVSIGASQLDVGTKNEFADECFADLTGVAVDKGYITSGEARDLIKLANAGPTSKGYFISESEGVYDRFNKIFTDDNGDVPIEVKNIVDKYDAANINNNINHVYSCIESAAKNPLGAGVFDPSHPDFPQAVSIAAIWINQSGEPTKFRPVLEGGSAEVSWEKANGDDHKDTVNLDGQEITLENLKELYFSKMKYYVENPSKLGDLYDIANTASLNPDIDNPVIQNLLDLIGNQSAAQSLLNDVWSSSLLADSEAGDIVTDAGNGHGVGDVSQYKLKVEREATYQEDGKLITIKQGVDGNGRPFVIRVENDGEQIIAILQRHDADGKSVTIKKVFEDGREVAVSEDTDSVLDAGTIEEKLDELGASSESEGEAHDDTSDITPPLITGGQIGSVVGSQMSAILGVDGRFESAAINTVSKTFLHNLGEVIDPTYAFTNDGVAILDANGNQLVDDGFDDFFSDLKVNTVSAGVGIAASFLTGELADMLDIGGDFGGALFSLATDQVVSAFLGEGLNQTAHAINFIDGTDALVQGLDALTNLDAWAGLGGGFVGGYLGRSLLDIDTQAEAIGSSIGSALGTIVGTSSAVTGMLSNMAIGQTIIPVPFVGAVIGAFVGTILGGFLGGLFGGSKPEPPPPPHAQAFMTLNEDGEFELDHIEMRYGGDGGGLGETVSSMANNLNAIIAAAGGAIANPEEFNGLRIGYTGNGKQLNGKSISSLQQGVDKGVLQTLRSLEIEGGDPIIERAIYNSDATSVQELVEDVQAAEQYRIYLDNKEEVNELLAAEASVESLLEEADKLEAEAAEAEVLAANDEEVGAEGEAVPGAIEVTALDDEEEEEGKEKPTAEELRAKAEQLTQQINFWKDVLESAAEMHLDKAHVSDTYSRLDRLMQANGVDFSGYALTDLVVDLSDGALTIAAKGPNNTGLDFESLEPRITIDDWNNWVQHSATLTLADGTVVSIGGLVNSFGVTETSGPIDLGFAMAERLGEEGIAGTDMDDVLVGTANDDLISGGLGRDVLKGGEGVDTADYSASAESVDVDLATGEGVGGDAQGDRLEDIENIIGSANNDTLAGDESGNTLTGAAGDDAIKARGGDDVILGGAGDDVINAGEGDDVVDGGDDSDTIFGGKGRDKIAGGDGGDSLFTGEGNDFATGGKGNDLLSGGSGNDILHGGSGDDVLIGGEGKDYMDGGEGIDTAIFDGEAGDYIVETIDGRTTVSLKDGTGEADVLKDVEFIQFDDSTVDVIDTVIARKLTQQAEEEENDSNGRRTRRELPSSASMMATAAAIGIAAAMATKESSAFDEFYDMRPDDVNNIATGGDETGQLDNSDLVLDASSQVGQFVAPPDYSGVMIGKDAVVASIDDGNNNSALPESPSSLVAHGMPDYAPDSDYEATFFKKSNGSEFEPFVAAANENAQDEDEGSGTKEPQFGYFCLEFSSPTASGVEDSPIEIENFWYKLSNVEKASIVISGVPQGVTLSAGTKVGEGVWSLNVCEMNGLQLIMPDDWSKDFNLVISVTAFTEGGDIRYSRTSSDTFTVQVQATTNAPTLTVTEITDASSSTTLGMTMVGTDNAETIYGGGGDDTVQGAAEDDIIYGDSIAANEKAQSPLDIVSAMVLPDADGTESLTIAVFGVPSDGRLIGNGISENDNKIDDVWWLTPEQLEGLMIEVPAGSIDYTVAVVATTTDIDPDTGPVTASTEPVEITILASDVAGNDELHGGDGADVLYGEDGADTLWGDAGDDSLYGGDGDDVLHVDADDTVIDGGEGTDTIQAAGSKGITVDVGGANAERAIGGDGSDIFYTSTVSAVHIDGGAGSDVLSGNDGNDTLVGGAGNDAFQAGKGDDVLHVDSEDTLIDAGDGTDTLLVEGSIGVDIDLGASNVEIAIGSTGGDVFRATGSDSVIVDGGDGDDLILAGKSRDDLTGGMGDDTLSYELSDVGVSASLIAGTLGISGYAQGDSVAGFENIMGSAYGDTLTGDDLVNQLIGNAGSDILNGGGGADSLSGGAGDDVIDGGDGEDTAVFSGNFGDYTVTKGAGLNSASVEWNGTTGTDMGIDTVTNVEKLQFDDVTLYLDGRNNIPYTREDSTTILEDNATVITKETLLANDIDIDGDVLTITGVNAAVNGTVVINEDGDIVFTPDENYFGDAAFTYTVRDEEGLEHSSTVTVNVEAVNDPPTVKPGGAQYSGQHSPYKGSGTVLGTDVDDADNSLTYELVSGSGFTVNPDGSFEYNGGAQTASMVVCITDPQGASSEHTISITNPAKPSGGGGKKPLAMDLDNDGLEFIGIDDSDVFMDVNDDGFLENLAWVAGDDGLLAFDRNGDGEIAGFDEISFVGDHPDARTDLEGLAFAYDSNGDGMFSAKDEMWERFGVWQDINENGMCEEVEFTGLDKAGITAVGLSSDWQAERIGDTVLLGNSYFTMANGEVGILGDVAFLYDDSRYMRIENENGSSSIVMVNEATGEGKRALDSGVEHVLAEIEFQHAEQTVPIDGGISEFSSPEDVWLQRHITEFEPVIASNESTAQLSDRTTLPDEPMINVSEIIESMASFSASEEELAHQEGLPSYGNIDVYFDESPEVNSGQES